MNLFVLDHAAAQVSLLAVPTLSCLSAVFVYLVDVLVDWLTD